MIIDKTQDKKTINLAEYDVVTIPRRELSFLGKAGLLAVHKTLLPLVTISPDLEGKHFLFRSGSNVGVIETNKLRVQVRPRLSAREFITLIRYVLSGKIPPDHFRSHSEVIWGTGFADALCMLLCDEIREILRIGLSRCYEERREPLNVLRGRPLWECNFPWRGVKAREIVCRHHWLTYDNLDNRLLLSGLMTAAFLGSSEDVRGGILQHLKTFRDLASETTPGLSEFERAEQGYNRLTEHYRTAHGLCRMLIFGLRPQSFYDDGKHVVTGVVLNMAELFEGFVARFMKDLLEPSGFTIRSQTPDRRALLDAELHRYASVRPDLEVWDSQRVRGVIDAKYKNYWETGADGYRPARKITNEDLYQLFFYQQRMQQKHDLGTLPAAIIASPLPETDEREGTPYIPGRFQRVIWQAGSERAGDVRLLLIPMTKILRMYSQGIRQAEIMTSIDLENIVNLLEG